MPVVVSERMDWIRRSLVFFAGLYCVACTSGAPIKADKELWEEEVWEDVDIGQKSPKDRNGTYTDDGEDKPVLPLSSGVPCVSTDINDPRCD